MGLHSDSTLPRRESAERGVARLTRFRRPTENLERLSQTLASPRFLVLARSCLHAASPRGHHELQGGTARIAFDAFEARKAVLSGPTGLVHGLSTTTGRSLHGIMKKLGARLRTV